MRRIADIKEKTIEAFQDNIYSVEDDLGDVEVSNTKLELKGEPEIIDATENTATLELRFDGTFDAALSYDNSTTGIWDSETKSQTFMERKHESTEKEEEFVVQLNAKFKPFDPDLFEIEDVVLVEPDDSYSVPTHRWEGFPWK